jgi:hypothetical protein
MAPSTLSDEVWQQVDLGEGWLFRGEAELLHRLNTGRWCEIGSWKGRSTFLLAQRGQGYAIDWFCGIEDPDYPYQGIDTYDEFLRNTRAVRQNLAILPMPFQEAVGLVKGPIDLLFLDAEHNYELTRNAFDLYSPLVPVGGHVVFHDARDEAFDTEGREIVAFPLPGVTAVVGEIGRDVDWLHTEDVQRCAVFRKVR